MKRGAQFSTPVLCENGRIDVFEGVADCQWYKHKEKQLVNWTGCIKTDTINWVI